MLREQWTELKYSAQESGVKLSAADIRETLLKRWGTGSIKDGYKPLPTLTENESEAFKSLCESRATKETRKYEYELLNI